MATPPIPMTNPDRSVAAEMRFEDPQFPQLASEERYDNLIKETLNIITANEGTNNFDLIKTKKAKEIIKTPYDMVGYFGRYLVPEKSPTKMTIREVIDFGRKLVNATQNKKDSRGKKIQPTSAMGKYQFLANSYVKQNPDNEGVLEEFANKLGLDIDTQLFTAEIQDKLAIKMIEERVPSLKDFAMSETDENINKVMDELNSTWRGISNSKGKTSKGQNVGKLSFEEIKNKLINTKQNPGEYGVGSDVDDTERMLKNERIDEQEIDSKPINPESLESQRERQRAITKQKSSINLNPISTAKGADLGTISETVKKELNRVNPIDADDTKNKMEVITPPTNAASDAFRTDQMMEEYNTVNEDEKFFRGSRNEDTEVEPLGDMSYPEDPIMSLDDDQGGEYTGQDYTISDDSEGVDNSEGFSFFRSLFTNEDTDTDIDDYIDEGIDYFADEANPLGGEADPNKDVLNFEHGGTPEADFDGKEEDAGDPPPLATPKEVADDIPAMLSAGEYVLPANVVRYIGLERVMGMHRQVLSEIQQMEDLGMIQNVDKNGEPEEDDKEMKFLEPEEGEEAVSKGTLIIASSKPKGMMCPEPLMMQEGGDTGAGDAEDPTDTVDDQGQDDEGDDEGTDTTSSGVDYSGGITDEGVEDMEEAEGTEDTEDVGVGDFGGYSATEAEYMGIENPNIAETALMGIYSGLKAMGLVPGTEQDSIAREESEAEASQPGDMDPNLELENNLDSTIKPEEIKTTSLNDDHIFIPGVGYVPRDKAIEGLMSPQV
jgi:muramidase (phage lysozyme)